MGPSAGITLPIILLLIHGCLSATRHDDICGDYNGRKLYLELGHRGYLSARDVAPDVSARGAPTNLTSAHHQCGMELVTCPSCVITVIFHYMNMSTCTQDGSCRCDYLWITEPPYEASGAPFCGYVKSPPTGTSDIGQAEFFGAFPRGYRENSPVGYRSRTRTLALSLLFASSHRHAFTLEYSSERNRQFLKGYRSGINANTTSGGFLTSPFFPAPYPRDLGAEHVITSSDSSARVRVLFSDFQLAGSSIIEFYDWNGQRLEVSSGAQFRPPVVVSSGPSLLVRFYANGGTGLGYKATYSFITGRIPESVMKPVTDCGGFVENIGGAITMMEMVPSGSVRSYDCVWIVRPPKFRAHLKTHLYLRVAQFQDMGGSTELHVRQGTTSETPLLEVLRLPSPSATSPLRHNSLTPSRFRRHSSLTTELAQRRASRLFGWLERPFYHNNEMEHSATRDAAEPAAAVENETKEPETRMKVQTNTAEIPTETVSQWVTTTLPTTGAPSSPQALVASPATDSPRSPPPRRRRPPPPVAARKQVGREHVLPLEVGFYVSLSGTFAHDSRLSIVFTAFSYMDCFTGTDFLCKNHRCIPGALTCDGFDHCGDASDEPPSCLTDNGDGNGPMEGVAGSMGMMGGMGGDSGIDRHWYSHTPNYYFPKMERYPDLKTATLVFIVSSLGLILLIAALIILLYRMGSRARQHRELQNRLQTISDLLGEYGKSNEKGVKKENKGRALQVHRKVVLTDTGPGSATSKLGRVSTAKRSSSSSSTTDDDSLAVETRPTSTEYYPVQYGARIEEISTDDPPDYEAPPTYEDVVKAGDSTSTSALPPPLEDECVLMGKERMGEGRRRARPRPGSTATSSAVLQDESPESSLPPPSISTLLPPPPHTSSRSCQTTPVPDSPPPTYETALLRASHSLSLTQTSILQSTSAPLFNSLSSGQHSGFASNHSSAPNSLPFMGALSESPERYLSASENEDGHSTMTDATMLDAVGEFDFLTTDPATEEASGNEDAATGTSGEDSGEVVGAADAEGVEGVGEGEEERGREGEVEEEAKENDERCDGEAGTSREHDAAESGGTGDAEDGEGEKEPEAAAAESEGIKEAEEASEESGEGGDDKGETEIADDLPERMPDSIPSEVPPVSDKEEDDEAAAAKEDGAETGGVEKDPEAAAAEAVAKEGEAEEGSDSEDECSESQKLIVTTGADEEVEEELEIDEEEVLASLDRKEGERTGEVKGEGEKERKKEMKRGYSEGGKDAVRIKEEATREEDPLGGTEEKDWEDDSAEERPKISSPHKDAVTHPHEIVGGIVKGHIKLFQSMTNKEEEEEGDARVVRRRVAMRGWRSVDVGYGGERLLED